MGVSMQKYTKKIVFKFTIFLLANKQSHPFSPFSYMSWVSSCRFSFVVVDFSSISIFFNMLHLRLVHEVFMHCLFFFVKDACPYNLEGFQLVVYKRGLTVLQDVSYTQTLGMFNFCSFWCSTSLGFKVHVAHAFVQLDNYKFIYV
jgi:hypothetical protein